MSLTGGVLLKIVKSQQVDFNPVLQVLNIRMIQNTSVPRFRCFVSDGDYCNSFAMMGTQLLDKVDNNKLVENSIIEVKNFTCSNISGKQVIVIQDFDLIRVADEKIGNPAVIAADGSVTAPANKTMPQGKRAASESVDPPAKRSPLANKSNIRTSILEKRSSTPFDPSTASVFPINALNPYQNKWTIKARVTKKGEVKKWSNARGEGKLFSMDLLDASGEIRCTAFKEQVDKFYDMIEVGKLYYITSCSLKQANKQYSNLNNDYEMSMRDSTEVILCNDDTKDIPNLSFNFVQIADLDRAQKDAVVDVIGVCKENSDVVKMTTRAGKEVTKRDLTIVDRSQAQVNLTLWGNDAEVFDGSANPVVAIKGAKVSDFNGVTLSASFQSVIQINPDISQAHLLKGWFDDEGQKSEIKSLTTNNAGGAGGADKGIGLIMKSLGEIQAELEGAASTEKPIFYSTCAYVTSCRKENALYKACNQQVDGKPCQKKVQEINEGLYRCEKCNKENDDFRWRMIVSLCLNDATGNQWVTAFQDEGEKLLGMSAEHLGQLCEGDPARYEAAFHDANFKQFNFRLSAKGDHYNDQTRIRHVVRLVEPVKVNEHIAKMSKELKENGLPLPDDFPAGLYDA